MRKYILEPKEISKHCFLLQALYWVAFHKYPVEEVDLSADNLSEALEFYDLDSPISIDEEFLFTPKFCATHNLPVNPYVEAILNGKKTYSDDSSYETLLNSNIPNTKKEELRKERKEARGYNKKMKDFEKGLEEYLEMFKAELFTKLKQGKIKSYALPQYTEYTYNVKMKKKFGKDFFEQYYPDIQDGDIFSVENECWSIQKPISIPKSAWRLNAIEWEYCTLKHEGKAYIFIQLDVEDLFKCFPEPKPEYKQIQYVEGQYLLEEEKETIHKTRGRKPKINHDEIILKFIANIDKYRGQKLESVIADFMYMYPNIGRTTLINKLAPLLKACSQK